ncbi:hypothetical protein PHYBLDRAFT_139594 [Phycomyces blakesleeanus NRRL 1555(-)]|uniref:Reverse transcriptase zinc-binding domain-containing protein n=1 Tax=Phycomyces blakesleeanus (strain ATCC 8743b / DSM 1359 / FGSC 10004 / NBRC 33097 / NRRL 1555) TaxID=763407 RepID=A0A162YBM4_PHYB8|nr:hypothetical protein PHYBLDRAFT_139594 [Phycomyces blakesleeanus NRRL 1555(-)]OAD79565.1 hypothetical protein PHYBLDRAFT_139594 [Phycomyces blakesleeanus NRRL 1555(-)]|eukprot:XP_018297605.1 hypothetical protein PHYBLDRAFT_139594 [Phycomyces blakesleeanus NRRL 1555(-)]
MEANSFHHFYTYQPRSFATSPSLSLNLNRNRNPNPYPYPSRIYSSPDSGGTKVVHIMHLNEESQEHIIEKISCRARLHSLLPLAFPSPTCSICSLSSDSQDHFFFTCPLKNAVWIGMWLEFFGTIPTPTALHNAFHFFFFPSSLNSSIPPSTVFGCTLLAIWRHHWTFIFDDSPFVPSAVVGTARKTLTRICQELDLDPLF